MNNILEKFFAEKSFVSSSGQTVKVHSETSREQCTLLQNIIAERGFKNSIEIGLAFGISAIAIAEAISKNGGRHLVIDRFQYEAWNGHGLELVRMAGYNDIVEFSDLYCYQLLPKLMEQQRSFDFAYIDSTKQFDWILVDFFYLDKILEIGGVVVFDDASFPGIRKVIRYVSQFPSYKVYTTFDGNKKTRATTVGKMVKAIPGARKLFREELLMSDYELGINSSCVALQKLAEDTRRWDWHVPF